MVIINTEEVDLLIESLGDINKDDILLLRYDENNITYDNLYKIFSYIRERFPNSIVLPKSISTERISKNILVEIVNGIANMCGLVVLEKIQEGDK